VSNDQDWPALSVLGGILVAQTVGIAICVRRLPVRAGQIRLGRSVFVMPSYALTTGLFFIGYGLYLQHVRGDETGSVPLFFSAFFILPASLLLWRRARWRLSIEAEGLRQRLWPFGERFLLWSQIAEINLEKPEGILILRTPSKKQSLSMSCEGLPFLLDAARARSIPVVGLTRDDHGWAIDGEV
jgi:hypothetical protein